jgi:hypothetical protein
MFLSLSMKAFTYCRSLTIIRRDIGATWNRFTPSN